ncbi:hypothetical protein SeMB42_g07789 [Synchytrium endobioticum]|uniref:Peptidase S1 domain-containing protein n=1 Tax=Synchytrium endobioticum TaxID=286115 RepID=A0A507C0Y5_9FUNG|nr:hypothetical protein SeMB42_g07789 [Synchytrium endobioticum]TPX36384.1 hypothetical protein SeLEV6574_g08078 [Synchytrium endobioticum]
MVVFSPLVEVGTYQYYIDQLTPKTKHLLKENHEKVLAELEECAKLMDSNDYISVRSRRKLAAVMGIAKALGYRPPVDGATLIDLLRKPITTKDSSISKSQRKDIAQYIAFLQKMLIKPDSIHLTSFDQLFDTRGLRSAVHRQLRSASVWRSNPDYDIQKIRVWGEVPPQDFDSELESLPSECFEYYQKAAPVADSYDDGCQEPGCRLREESDILQDYRHDLPVPVAKVFSQIDSSNSNSGSGGGTIGMFINIGKRRSHYIITAAHVLFPELSKLALEDLAVFNDNVSYAIYNEEYDIAIVACQNGKNHNNSFRLVDKDLWETPSKSGIQVVKVEQKSGWTMGELKSDDASIDRYNHMMEVKGDGAQPFAEPGDSGSIYYAWRDGLYIPIAIHRISRDGSSYGCQFVPALQAVLEKMNVDYDDVHVCMWSSLRNTCEFAHLKNV